MSDRRFALYTRMPLAVGLGAGVQYVDDARYRWVAYVDLPFFEAELYFWRANRAPTDDRHGRNGAL